MNLNIYLEDQLGQELIHLATVSKQSKNSIIRQALKQWITDHHRAGWPNDVINFQGQEDFLPFEHNRADLLLPQEDFVV